MAPIPPVPERLIAAVSKAIGTLRLPRARAWLKGSIQSLPEARKLAGRGLTVAVIAGVAWLSTALGSTSRSTPLAYPGQPRIGSYLIAATRVTGGGIWAVGLSSSKTGTAGQPLVLHYLGGHWHHVSAPPVGGLESISAASPRNIWTVSQNQDGSGRSRFLHWDGRRWKEYLGAAVMGPPAGEDNVTGISSLAAISPHDAWAVGSGYRASYRQCGAVERGQTAIIEHFNGQSWSLSASPPLPAGESELTAIGAIGRSDVWTVGRWWPTVRSCRDRAKPSFDFLEHWNGRRWSLVKTPIPIRGDDVLPIALEPLGASRAMWLAAEQNNGYLVLAELRGDHWHTIPAPPVGPLQLDDSISSTGPDDLWASGSNDATFAGVVNHWNGRRWSTIRLPGGKSEDPWSVVAVTPGNAWVVGRYVRETYDRQGGKRVRVRQWAPLILHRTAGSWSTISGRRR
jgi:hypothetical protein